MHIYSNRFNYSPQTDNHCVVHGSKLKRCRWKRLKATYNTRDESIVVQLKAWSKLIWCWFFHFPWCLSNCLWDVLNLNFFFSYDSRSYMNGLNKIRSKNYKKGLKKWKHKFRGKITFHFESKIYLHNLFHSDKKIYKFKKQWKFNFLHLFMNIVNFLPIYFELTYWKSFHILSTKGFHTEKSSNST